MSAEYVLGRLLVIFSLTRSRVYYRVSLARNVVALGRQSPACGVRTRQKKQQGKKDKGAGRAVETSRAREKERDGDEGGS